MPNKEIAQLLVRQMFALGVDSLCTRHTCEPSEDLIARALAARVETCAKICDEGDADGKLCAELIRELNG